MKSKFTWILTLCLALFIQISFAQEKTISGTVVSKTDKTTMPGVNILVKGTNRGTQTDLDGGFTIKASVGEQLVISSIGSKTQTITVGASNKITVELEDEAAKLEEVVVEGYNVTRTKAVSNVASQTIGAKTIEARPNANFINSLQSQVAGLNIASSSGQPGSNVYAVIRGSGSINGEDEPLYIIDGTPMASDNFRSLNSDDIESVSVLKDAGAVSIYGSRGANGVIVVKTRKANFDSNLSIKYTATSGFTRLQNTKFDMMNSQQLLKLERSFGNGFGAVNNNGGPMTDEQIAAAPNTDWRKVFFRTGLTQNHVLSLSSGSKTLASFTSYGYFEQQGTLQGTDLKRFSFRNNLSGKSNNDRFTYGSNISINYSRRHEANVTSGAGVNQNLILGAFKGVPYLDPSGYVNGQQLEDLFRGYTAGSGLVYTPYMLMDKLKTFANQTEEVKGVGNVNGAYKFTKNLTFGTNFGVDYTSANTYNFTHPDAFNEVYFQQQQEQIGKQSMSYAYTALFNWVNKLNYNKKFGEKHTLDVSLLTEYNKNHTAGFGYWKQGIDPKQATPGTGAGYANGFDDFDFLNSAGITGAQQKTANKASTGLFSYFGTVDYDYAGKFGVGGTLRRDASSRFANTNRWGTFYSVSGRWNIDKEAFMENSGISLLKLRGSYGTNGNQDIVGNTFGGLNLTRTLFTGSYNGYGTLPAYGIAQIGINDLKWETSQQLDLGLDFEFMKRRFRGTIDFYNKKALDLYQDVPVSLITPAGGSISKNYGAMVNKGAELTLHYDVVKSVDGFNFTLNFNGSYNKNRVLDVANPQGLIDNTSVVTAEGHANNEYVAVRYIGVNPANGNMLFLDRNGNPTENPTIGEFGKDDRVYTGKTVLPKYQGGFGFDSDYKGFYLNTQFAYVAKSWKYDYDLLDVQNQSTIGISNMSQDLLRAWNGVDIINTDMPSLNVTNSNFQSSSDRYLRDASYLRLKYVKLGYDFPKKWLSKTPFTSFNIYIQAENLVTWTKWRGMDVESPGNNQNNYPTSKISTVGLQLQF